MIKAVIFDLDGTLIDANIESAKEKVCKELQLLIDRGYSNIKEEIDTIHHTCNLTGVYDRNKWWEKVHPGLALVQKQYLTNTYWEQIMATTTMKPHALEVLHELKEKKIILVLLTDYDGESFSKKERITPLPLIQYFDLVVIAGEDTKQIKPDPHVYTYIMAQIHVPPEEVLMVGDKPDIDLAGADMLGINTLLIQGDYGHNWHHTTQTLKGVLTCIENLNTQ
ncbi:MAG: HAD family hydrolase [Candidatus Methanofastidiosia archaeon]|jgi:putative hydrolase of the HAD superfamily